ncbi:unnamed protein product [Hydatigera taeniaeformis]|uniref:Zf-RVT domain-containing protein n=1 Tax=Hydatigena taeniaeformis TaxID=6205 RepID=A0A0R3WWF2_HYDTA|nr:unnamed protein product [Hydatigera taeniaeformis]
MDEELEAIFTDEIDEEFKRNLSKLEQSGTTQTQDVFFSNRFDVVVPEDAEQKTNRCLACLKGSCISAILALHTKASLLKVKSRRKTGVNVLGIWATRNKEIKEDKETIIRTTVRDILIYAGFITVILISLAE